MMKIKIFNLLVLFLYCTVVPAENIRVGAGSYTTAFPGTDKAGRNSYPSGSPQISGNAVGQPVPTNDWWSAAIKENHVQNLFTYPYTLRTIAEGVVISYIPFGVIDDLLPVTMGIEGLQAPKVTVADYSDWTVTLDWSDGNHEFQMTAGIAMPFLYFTKQPDDVVRIAVTSGTVSIDQEMLVIEKAKNGASFAVYAPAGSSWTKEQGIYTSTLNGKDYWSVGFLPQSAENIQNTALEYKKYAYVFPADTKTSWQYNETTSVVRTDFSVTTEVKEGEYTEMLLGLLPHQWAHLAADSPYPDRYSYTSVRGEIKTLAGNGFSVENTFHGILPTLPYVETASPGFSEAKLTASITDIQDDIIDDWTDSYNDGQLLNRLVQTGRIAAETGNETALEMILNTVKSRIENWLKADPGEVAFLFYYNKDWSALLGYPAGHGQDSNLNDHHFHWGYFIHAAAFVEQYRPGWAAQWGDMVNLLIRDAACTDRNDPMFPFMRNFSPYAGHCWANGFATFPQGNDQESTSESMQFNSALIHWGAVTGNKAVRDLGIYLYTTEQTAIEEYWFDVYERNFLPTQQYSLVSRIWGNSYDNGTFWTNDIAASYGIELYPIHAGSLYLAHHPDYVNKLWEEITRNTGILNNEANDNLWHDIMWQYQAFTDPAGAIALYDSYPGRSLKFGISDALTYHWIHAMNVLGQVDATLTADYPVAAVFNKNGRMTYVAHNYGTTPLTVTFSDGYRLDVPAGQTATASAGSMLPSVAIKSPANNTKFAIGETVVIIADATDYNGEIRQVEFYQNGILLGKSETAPYKVEWTPEAGDYTLTAKATNDAGKEAVSKPVNIKVTNDSPCGETSKEASQGSFETGYTAEFETTGTDVTLTFELLDTKNDISAYFWNYTPEFRELPMTRISDTRYTITLNNQEPGTTLLFACKFAFEGGMAVTKQFEYVVGTSCGPTALETLPATGEMRLYPNPVKSELFLRLPCIVNRICMWNIKGDKLLEQDVPAACSIDMEKYESGIYFIRVECNKGIYTGKIVKQ